MKIWSWPTQAIWLCLIVGALLTNSVSASEDKPRFNILLIVTDDQRWDQLGVVQQEQGELARFPYLETPRLDALASQGIRFRNAFVTTSLCSPSRSAILTGQYNHTNGTLNNRTPFSAQASWATALQSAGYTTAYIGKWHHGGQLDRPGFDYTATYTGQGKYNDNVFLVNSKRVKTAGYIDKNSVDFAIDYLEKHKRKPFAMMVGFKGVHQPFTPMEKHADRYSGGKIVPATNWRSVAPWSEKRPPFTRRNPGQRPFWMDILRTVDGIDYNLGRLMDALDHLQLAHNTLVIFTSDNGYHLGEHQLGDKRTAYEESIRVPMIVRLPNVVPAASVSDEMVLNIDLAPTIIDLAGEAVPSLMQGRSMLPLLKNTSDSWRDSFLYEYWQEYVHGKAHKFTAAPTILSVRTKTHKLITYPDNTRWTELYDLVADPHEMHNLAGYRQYAGVLNDMCNRLDELVSNTGYVPVYSLNTQLKRISFSDHDRYNYAQSEYTFRPPLRNQTCKAGCCQFSG